MWSGISRTWVICINILTESLKNNDIDNLFTKHSAVDCYLNLLQDVINPMITELVENSVEISLEIYFFIQYVFFFQNLFRSIIINKCVRDFVVQYYPNRWIFSRWWFLERPPCSRDQAINVLFLLEKLIKYSLSEATHFHRIFEATNYSEL